MRISDWSSDVCSSDLQLKLGSAVVDADITLYDQPRIVADIQLAQTHVRSVDIAVGRVKVDSRNGSGQAQALLEGTSGVLFRVAVHAHFQPTLWIPSVQGWVTGHSFTTISPTSPVPGDQVHDFMAPPASM